MVKFKIKSIIKTTTGTTLSGIVECDQIKTGDRIQWKDHSNIISSIIKHPYIVHYDSAFRGEQVELMFHNWSKLDIQKEDVLTCFIKNN